MTITEAARHHLVTRAQEVLGTEAGMTLAEHLPPVGWADVATRQDLDGLEARMALRFESMALRFESIDPRFESIDLRFESIELRFESIDLRFKSVDEQFKAVHERFQKLEEGLDHRFAAQDFKMEALEHRLLGAIYQSATAQTRTFVVALISTLIAFSGVGLAAAQLAAR